MPVLTFFNDYRDGFFQARSVYTHSTRFGTPGTMSETALFAAKCIEYYAVPTQNTALLMEFYQQAFQIVLRLRYNEAS